MADDPSIDTEAEIANLNDLDLERLKARWRSAFGRTAPAHLSRPLLLRLLAYRLQAQIFGDLQPATRRMLDSLAKRNGTSGGRAPSVPVPGQGRLMKGAVLVREYEGHLHHVTVAESGFVWNGETYPSLSKVAFAITGTKWNGPRFFGLREARS